MEGLSWFNHITGCGSQVDLIIFQVEYPKLIKNPLQVEDPKLIVSFHLTGPLLPLNSALAHPLLNLLDVHLDLAKQVHSYRHSLHHAFHQECIILFVYTSIHSSAYLLISFFIHWLIHSFSSFPRLTDKCEPSQTNTVFRLWQKYTLKQQKKYHVK